jgi:hypothetical protein
MCECGKPSITETGTKDEIDQILESFRNGEKIFVYTFASLEAQRRDVCVGSVMSTILCALLSMTIHDLMTLTNFEPTEIQTFVKTRIQYELREQN